MESFGAIVIGTGFGGAVSAWKLAKAKVNVLILERGRKYGPGDFPRAPHLLGRNVWSPQNGRYGLFDFWQFRALDAVTASGVGGGSLIYANVLLRKDVFPRNQISGEHWPESLGDLKSDYRVVETMLGGAPYPLDRSPYDRTAKAIALREAAEALGLDFRLPNLAISFGNGPGQAIPGESKNIHKRARSTCRLCGECDIGCNYGSKNTLDFNFISEACKAGAELRPLSEVVWLRPSERGGYEVGYRDHEVDREAGNSRR